LVPPNGPLPLHRVLLAILMAMPRSYAETRASREMQLRNRVKQMEDVAVGVPQILVALGRRRTVG
jgi:hypothetical protein